MTRMEWINLLGLLAVVAGGSTYVGRLSGRLDAINPEAAIVRINEARDAALGAIERAKGGFSDPEGLHAETFEWKNGQSDVQMIRVSEGICYLVAVTGRFQGYGEEVSTTQRVTSGSWVGIRCRENSVPELDAGSSPLLKQGSVRSRVPVLRMCGRHLPPVSRRGVGSAAG